MSVYRPICTCHINGILGCAQHTYGQDPEPNWDASVDDLAKLIASGGAFNDADAIRVARAFLEAQA